MPITTETFRKIVLEIGDGVIGVDLTGVIRFANPAAESIFGWSSGKLSGQELAVLLPRRARQSHADLVASFHYGEIDTKRMGQRGSGIVGLRADGSEVNVGITILKTDADGEPLMIAVVRDISDHVNLQLELKRLADTDPLTGLLNRRAFFEQARLKIDQRPEARSCIAMLDLDHFKTVNDRFGHECGDRVIRDFADICLQSVRSQDLVARFGGEEFVLLLDRADQVEAFEVAETIRKRTSLSVFFPKSSPLRVTVSAGVAELHGDLAEAIQVADTALYEAKHAGRNRVLRAVA